VASSAFNGLKLTESAWTADQADTIIAPATAPGESGISIVRISGPRAAESLRRWFRPRRKRCRWSSHRLYFGEIKHPRTDDVIDQGLAVLMRAPRSYTGEDVAELHCHGSHAVVHEVLELAREEGLRLAYPGEFTMRAVMNGRMDLAQAESVLEVITARSERALRQANAGVAGAFSRSVESIRGDLVRTQAFLEASIDFSEDEIPAEDVHEPIQQALTAVTSLRQRAHSGLLYRSGVRVALMGRPNVGKSSLLNALLRANRAIVTEIPGTTRDTIEESAIIEGIPMVLVDTAGIRSTGDEVERLGVERARLAIRDAVIRLIVIDRSSPLTEDDLDLLADEADDRAILALNKSDLPDRVSDGLSCITTSYEQIIAVSALTGMGLAELERALAARAIQLSGANVSGEEVLAIPRHVELLAKTEASLERTLKAIDASHPVDVAAAELAIAARALGEITGVNPTEDLFDTIFSRFCLGK
jgi:tRNA modification GTPase